MLEAFLSRWKGKLFVLVLLGFVATDFVITITLSAADASAHIIENPFVKDSSSFLEHPVPVTLGFDSVLGAVFLKGFKEAIGIAVFLVGIYLFLNLIVVDSVFIEIATHPELFPQLANRGFYTVETSSGILNRAVFFRSSACRCSFFRNLRSDFGL